MIGDTISHYEILEKIGEGGMGVVYKARDTKLQRFVAIKVLPSHLTADEEAKTRFVREARAASALEHPSICHIHEIGETPEGHLYMVMPCYEGETLGERIDQGPLEVEEALDIITQVASALARAHEKNIIHRDIKPGNVMLTGGGQQAKLMDFGLARKLDATKVTRTGTTIGTVAYMSPEQVLGKKTDHRTDIWALGVVIYEMLTGRQPFQGDYEPAVLYSIINEEPEPVTGISKDVPPGVENVVEKALSKDVAKRYQTTAELLADLEEQRDQIKLGVRQRRFIKLRKKTRKRLLRVGLPVVLAVVAAFVIFVVQPFELEIRTKTKQAIAQENSMAIMFFENIADPADKELMASIVKNALITDLGDSEYIRVIGEQRQHDILRQLGKEDLKELDRSVAAEVAKLAGVNWILTGKILSLEPNIILTSEISHVATGEARQQRARSEAGEDLFAVVDKLTKAVREDLTLPGEADEEPDRAVADVTTHSMDAYRHYVEGMDYLSRDFGYEAKVSFEQALRYDSTFAMAYLRLASAAIPTTSKEKKGVIEKAVQYSERANKKEKLYIESYHAELIGDESGAITSYEAIVKIYPDETEAYYRLGRLHWFLGNAELALENLMRAIEINPLDKRTYDSLAHIYQTLGDIEKSIWAINALIAIAPDEASPYDTRGYLYAYRGNIDRAIESFSESVERNPDFGSLTGLGHMYLFKEEYANAGMYYQKQIASGNEFQRAWGRLHLAFIPLCQGKLDEALEILDRGISEDRLEGFEGNPHVWKIYLRSLMLLEKKNHEQAVSDAYKFIAACKKISAVENVYYDDPFAMLLARNKEFSEAEEYLNSLKDKIQESSVEKMSWYWLARGWLEMEKGNIDAACGHFEKANEFSKWFIFRYSLALAYLEANRLGETVQVFELAINKYDATRAFYATYAVKMYYYLGLAYEKSGSAGKAAEQYGIFLDIWENADPGIAEVEDARARQARLK